MLCFSPEWINSAGVMLDASKYDDVYNREKNCYELAKKNHTQVVFDYSAQKLLLDIPRRLICSVKVTRHDGIMVLPEDG